MPATKSRIHSLKMDLPNTQLYIKRDDELSFTLSGSKARKYSTLLPKLKAMGVRNILMMGGPFSNHICSAAQLFIQEKITPHLLLSGRKPDDIKGNYLLTKMLVPEERITWITKAEWGRRHLIGAQWAKKWDGAFVLDEGGSVKESLLGALTLPLDILRSEEEISSRFDHIFIEAGTGMMASALALHFSSINHPAKIHILLLGDDEETFKKRLTRYRAWMEQEIGTPIKTPKNIVFHVPSSLKSFGATSKPLFQFITRFAQTEGVLLDPIYSGKLFYNLKQMIESQAAKGSCLFIHSGGQQTLAGFQQEMAATCG